MWREWLDRYGGRVAGVAAALFLSVIFLCFGFWDMLFVGLLLWIGYSSGYRKDKGGEPLFPWRRLLQWLEERFRRYR